jgi:outer membrane usher protein
MRSGSSEQVNDQRVARQTLQLRADAQGEVQPCLNREILEGWGVDLEKLDANARENGASFEPMPAAEDICAALVRFLPESRVDARTAELRLEISIPQKYLRRTARDWVDPTLWEDGMTAGTVRYNINANRTESANGTYDSASLGVNAGLNVGAWRLRHDGYLRWSDSYGSDYRRWNTCVRRDIRPWRAQLLLGESFIPGDLFTSINFQGAQLRTDERMLPSSQRGFAPVVRGVANENSRVTIYQQGRVIFETNVANGPFEIDDLYATAYGGDLEVVITAADGSTQRFTQPYAAVPQLLRPGQNRFSLAAGQVRSWAGADDPYLVEGTWRRGISNALTGYGGIRLSEGYAAVQAGTGINLPNGALSVDVTSSRADNPLGGGDLRGQSYRLTYSKELFARRTTLSVAAYRYSTRDYRDLPEHVAERARTLAYGVGGYLNIRQRSRLDLSLSQRLPEGYGSVWVSGNTARFWDERRERTSYSLGYSNAWRNVSFGLNAQRARIDPYGVDRYETQYGRTLTVPLGDAGRDAPRLTLAATQRGEGRSYRAGLNGNVGESFYYGAGLTDTADTTTGFNGYAGYRSRFAEFYGFYSQAGGYRSASAGMSGGLVVHGGGLTLASSPADNIALVQAEGAAGAKINGDIVRVDRRGYAVVGSVMPYRLKTFQMDASEVDERVRLLGDDRAVAPTLGAVVPVVFRTERAGATRLVFAPDAAGQPLVFWQRGAGSRRACRWHGWAGGPDLAHVQTGGHAIRRSSDRGGHNALRSSHSDRCRDVPCKPRGSRAMRRFRERTGAHVTVHGWGRWARRLCASGLLLAFAQTVQAAVSCNLLQAVDVAFIGRMTGTWNPANFAPGDLITELVLINRSPGIYNATARPIQGGGTSRPRQHLCAA